MAPFIAPSGVHFKGHLLTGGTPSRAYMLITPRMTGGWYRADCWVDSDGVFMNMYKGQVLMFRIVK